MRKELILDIEKLAYGGEGLGYAEGIVCFVEGALPGEKVRGEVVQKKKNLMRLRLVEILRKSPERTEPPCVYYGRCGGCQYQHLAYREELRWKEIQVREYMERQLSLDGRLVGPITGCSSEYGYRISAAVHPAGKAPCAPGFFGLDNETVLPVAECRLLRPPLNDIFRRETASKDGTVYKLSSGGKILCGEDDCLFEMSAGGETFVCHTKGFVQANPEITGLIGAALKALTAERTPGRWIDLYAGAGTFTWLASPRAERFVFCEENPYAVLALKENLRRRGMEAVVLEGAVEKEFPRWHRSNPAPGDRVFLDPPRKGMEPAFTDFLGSAGFERLVYLSCHLGTLVRDLKAILAQGKYRIASVKPFDMFPRTKHIEVLVCLDGNH